MRDNSIDNIKGLFILLVVLNHCLSLSNAENTRVLHNMIYCFHMPLFMFLSGYFTKKNEQLISGIKSVFETFIVFHIYYIFATPSFPHTLYDLATPQWTYWYLLSLVFCRLLVLYLPFDKWNWVVVVTVAIVISIIIGFIPLIGYPLSLSRTIVFFLFFILGYYGKYNLIINNIRSTRKNSCLFFLGMCCLVISFVILPDLKSVFAGFFAYVAHFYFCHPAVTRALFYVIAILTSITLIRLISNNKFLAEVGRNTMLFYVYHSFMIYLAKRLSSQLGVDSWSVFALFCFAAFIMGIVWITKIWKTHQYISHPISNIIENIKSNNTKIKEYGYRLHYWCVRYVPHRSLKHSISC